MSYYLFKLNLTNDENVRTYKTISPIDSEYINYNKFLIKEHLTNIKENDDFIPMIIENKALFILRNDQFDIEDLDDIFELLNNNILIKKEDCNESEYLINF